MQVEIYLIKISAQLYQLKKGKKMIINEINNKSKK